MSIQIDNYRQSALYQTIDFGGSPVVVTMSHLREHPIHFHEHLEVVYVIQGSIVVKMGSDEFTIVDGEYIFINAYELHALWKTSEDAVIAYVHFHLDSGAEMPLVLYDINRLKKDMVMYQRVQNRILEILRQSADPVMTTKEFREFIAKTIDSFYSDLRYAKYEVRGEKNPFEADETNLERLSNAIDYMYLHFDEKLTLEHVANVLHVSKSHLAHIIKRGYNISFQELLNVVRADRSELLLLESEMPISRVYAEVGASSQNYYTRFFRESFGTTPLQYRKLFQKETIQHKYIDEDVCDKEEQRSYILGAAKARQQKGDITINLSTAGAQVHMVRENGVSTESEDLDVDKLHPLSLNFDGDELILIIRRRF